MRLIPRRALPIAALLACSLGLPAAATAAPVGFTHSVTAADVRSSSAILWARATRPGVAVVQLTTGAAFGTCSVRDAPKGHRVRSLASNDFALQRKIGGLRADTGYRYRFCMPGGRQSEEGAFTTPPASNANQTIHFAISGDQDATPPIGGSSPFWGDFGVLQEMAGERNDFNILLGDTIYSDSEVPGQANPTLALGVKRKWGKYQDVLEQKPFADLRSSAAFYGHWDDHEFINDFSPAENAFEGDADDLTINGRVLYRRGRRAFRDYTPVSYSRTLGIYRTFRWGRNLELFFLDERSFRSAKADANHVCDNPSTGQPDLAPTADGTTARALFGLVVPSLAQPVAPACLAAINNPNRTMLGSRQLAAFKREILRSDAKFKLIINELPIQQYYALPYDRWEGYAAERRALLAFLRDKVKNVMFLTTDVHANFVNDARIQTLEPGGPQNTGILEVSTGPVATKTYDNEIDEVAGAGVGAGVYAAFFKPPPPQGVGMSCAATDIHSYAEVTVSASQVRIDLKDDDGAIVRESVNGVPQGTCGPYVINAE